LQIKPDVEISDKICLPCKEKVISAYDLRQKIIESDNTLRKASSGRITIVPIDRLIASTEEVPKYSAPVVLKKVNVSPALAKTIQKSRKQTLAKVIIPTVHNDLENTPMEIESVKVEAASWIQLPPSDLEDDKTKVTRYVTF
jgi:hypothetical protein